ncbi:MAG: glycoside hydrolase family 65 protein [Phycisphaeraceae bacterium]|nr:glycoside hydrolase family 65 protein [Phycisphaeraceae bacterium]
MIGRRGWTGVESAPREPAYLGNGLIGLRPSVRNPLDEYSRCYVSGLVEREPKWGITQLAELPNPFHILFRLDRHPAGLDCQSQSLDMGTGVLTSDLVGTDASGRTADIRVVQVAYRSVPCLLGMHLRVIPDQTGSLSLELRIAPPRNTLVQSRCMASVPGVLGDPGDLRVEWHCPATGSACGMHAVPVLDPATHPPRIEAMAHRVHAQVDTLRLSWARAEAGKPLELDWIVALVSSRYHPRPLLQAGRMVRWASAARGIVELNDDHAEQWRRIWRSCPVIDGDDLTQDAVEGSMYHLHASIHRSSRTSIAPFGLSSNAYYGHVFWDCETWVFPALLLQSPETARNLLEFRLSGLDQSRMQAALFGFDGAMFPWEAIDGGAEDTPAWAATGCMEHHITPNVALAFWQYQCITGDRSFLHRGTWPVLSQVARWIVSRVEKTSRGYEIRHLIPADEYSFNIDNSTHMNMACASALRAATACAALVGEHAPALWNEIAQGLVIPRDERGNILQQDGWTPEHRSKQADTILAVYPLHAIHDPVDIAGILRDHVQVDAGHACAAAMGDQINAVVCARAGRQKLARTAWDRGWKPYWIDVWSMYAETARRDAGCFITGCGGMLQAILAGFPGLQLDLPQPAAHPVALPQGWKSITCPRLWIRGRPHSLNAAAGMSKALLEPIGED